MDVLVTAESPSAGTIVEDLLRADGVHVLRPIDVGAGTSLLRGHGAVDAVIAVLWSSDPMASNRSSAILVEIGIAIGRGIPLLLVCSPDQIPATLGGVPIVTAGPDDVDLLMVQLRLFLRAAEYSRDSPLPTLPPNRAGSTTQTTRHAGKDLEDYVRQLLVDTGADVVDELPIDPSRTARRVDIAFSVPGHERDIGVVLVEVKRFAPGTEGRLQQAAAQLSEYVLASRAGLGLLIYDGPDSVTLHTVPLVVGLNLRTFQERLRTKPLADVLLHARNEAIHSL